MTERREQVFVHDALVPASVFSLTLPPQQTSPSATPRRQGFPGTPVQITVAPQIRREPEVDQTVAHPGAQTASDRWTRHEYTEWVPGEIGIDPERLLRIVGPIVQQPGTEGEDPFVL